MCRCRGVTGRMRSKCGASRLAHRDFTIRPRTSGLDCFARSVVIGAIFFEEVKYLLGAFSRPEN
jgi:hypothetical protein